MKTFRQFLEEANAPKSDAHKTISRNWERKPGHQGLNVYVSKKEHEGTPNIEVHDLWVPKHLRGKGVGGRIMKGLTRHADKIKATMSLNQAPEKGYKTKLSDFYKKHGFVPNKGKKRNLSISNTHIRQPNS